MKYYEFNNNAFSYYGLIGAPNVESAKECFYEHICEPEEDDGEPDEITIEEAKQKYIEAIPNAKLYGIEDDFDFDKDQEASIKRNEPWLILIDGSLI